MDEIDSSPSDILDGDNAKDETHKESTFCEGKFIIFLEAIRKDTLSIY